ncbi:hypothetical protein [Corallococcus sp. CA049B]|uniref:hypothetical protein n=1 Tax=Corallococcus sp. CA049B TaxID=2316730 RepID=UPI0018F5B550|nr:hypothetical protein [Corallococcus sp. CA049B]
MRAKLVAGGMPAPGVGISLGLYRASRDGEFAAVDPTLRQLLGREPKSMRELLAGKLMVRERG